ncbi:MAG: hypothetical protein WCC06_08320 [Candidatus Aminicenantales bacterium]
MTCINTEKNRKSRKRSFVLGLFVFGLTASLTPRITPTPIPLRQDILQEAESGENLLRFLGITASAESISFITNKTQFQLHTLVTEQRHPKTWNLSERIQRDIPAGLRMLLAVDEDVTIRLEALARGKEVLEQMALEIEKTLLAGEKIYIYGCGATGRLAKQMESTFWRPFWKKVKGMDGLWAKVKTHLGENIEESLVGEMTGADRALISSLEGFEDLPLIGRLQLEDRKVTKGDIVICVTEGGETSSVIGTILTAHAQWKKESGFDPEESRKKLYFIYNNPDEKLFPFERSRKVIEEKGITKINLTTGPQAITGSTRMQATTIETFVIGNVLQAATEHTLRKFLSKKDMARLGFKEELKLEEKLREFPRLLQEIKSNIPSLSALTELESQTYSSRRFATYFAQKALITVFIDSTERSPTFRLFPLDTVKESKRKCWIQVWTDAPDLKTAWQTFLGRPFRGLSPELYRRPFEEEIGDSYLQAAALESLKRAGNDQQWLYDFSFSGFNIEKRGPKPGDLGVIICISPEEAMLQREGSAFKKFLNLFVTQGAKIALILIQDNSLRETSGTVRNLAFLKEGERSPFTLCCLEVSSKNDPFGLNQQIALKILLNTHSTAVMARLGKVIGNTMTNVSPSNLKLIGRATYLIQSHVNDVLRNPQWVRQNGVRSAITYGEANAVLFEAIAFLKDKSQAAVQAAEVPLSIIRILESLRQKRAISQEEALELVIKKGLSHYISLATSTEK